MIEREPEDEIEDLERAAEKVQDDIDETQSGWESNKGDESVPGAVGDDDLGHETFGEQEDEGGG